MLDQATVNDLHETAVNELRAKVRWLEVERAIDRWKLQQAHECMGKLEARLDRLEVPVALRGSGGLQPYL